MREDLRRGKSKKRPTQPEDDEYVPGDGIDPYDDSQKGLDDLGECFSS